MNTLSKEREHTLEQLLLEIRLVFLCHQLTRPLATYLETSENDRRSAFEFISNKANFKEDVWQLSRFVSKKSNVSKKNDTASDDNAREPLH